MHKSFRAFREFFLNRPISFSSTELYSTKTISGKPRIEIHNNNGILEITASGYYPIDINGVCTDSWKELFYLRYDFKNATGSVTLKENIDKLNRIAETKAIPVANLDREKFRCVFNGDNGSMYLYLPFKTIQDIMNASRGNGIYFGSWQRIVFLSEYYYSDLADQLEE